MIRGGIGGEFAVDSPTTLNFGCIIVENGAPISLSDDRFEGEDSSDRFFTELNLGGLQVDHVWKVMTAHAAAIDAEASDYIFEHNGVVVTDSGTFNSNTFVKTIVMETLGLSSMIGYLPPDPNGYWPGIAEWYALQPSSGYSIDGYIYKLGTAANDTITAPNSSNHGGDGVDTILGGAGNDVIWGGSSGDTLGGGNGNDTIHGNDGIDLINGGNGSDTADYSTALGGISVDLDEGEASADGDAGSDTLISIENVRGSNFNDIILGNGGNNIFYGSAGTDEIDGFGGDDTADYSRLTRGIVFVSTEIGAGTDTVEKDENDVTTEDTLIFVKDITGTNQADEFHGTNSDIPNRIYSGLGGADIYSFDLAADIGSVSIVDGDSVGLNTLKFLNYNPSTMRLDFIKEGDEIDIEFYKLNTSTSTWHYGGLRVNVNADEEIGFSVDNVMVGSDLGRLSDIATYAGGQTAATYSYADFEDVLDLPQWQPGTGGTGAGGGALPTVEGGVITGMQVSPTITTGSGVPYQYAETIMHPWVLTSFSAGGGSATLNYETATKEIIFQRGISVDNVRFNASSSQGNASLTIYLDDLNYSFTMNSFEAGKSITGFTKYDTALHSWVQGSSSSSLNHNGGDSFSGVYANANSPGNWITTYNYLYFLEKLTFTNGSIDMQENLVFEGTSAGESLYGLDTRDDTVYGYGGADTLRGYGGNDILIGGASTDSMFGGEGNDTYLFNTGFGQDYITDDGGTDAIKFGTGITLSDLRFWKSNDNLIIYAGSDQITLGSHFSDLQNNTTNYDEVESLLFADASTLDLKGSLTFTGTSAGDSVYGTSAADTLVGLGGNDTLYGGLGNDLLVGGAGSDSIFGDEGSDAFVFKIESAFDGVDAIYDFDLSESDKVDLSDLLGLYNAATDDITDFVEITTSGSNSILKIDADGGGNNFVQIATLYGITGLTDEEVLVTNGTLIVSDGVSIGLFASHYAIGSNISSLSQIDWTATPAHTEVVTSINQTGNSSTPFYAGGPTDRFAVSYEGHLNVVTAGTYTFNLTSDDGSALWIDGVELIDNDGLHSAGTDSASIYLTAGLHELEAHYFEATGDQIMKLEWSGADTGNAMQVISGSALQNEGVGVNVKPVAGNDIVNTYVEVPANIFVLGNDKDDDGDEYEITSVTQGAHGSVTINQNGTLTYTPTTNYYGLDSFTYTITDSNGGTDTGTVDVTVIDDSNSISENFESGASGWSNNTTNDTSTTFTEFLGRFAGATSGQDTSKTFTLSGDQSHITVSFDFYKIDSWDNEAFEVYLNDTLVFTNGFSGSSSGSSSGTFTGGSWDGRL